MDEKKKIKNGLDKGLVQRLVEQVQKHETRIRILEKLAGIEPGDQDGEVHTDGSSDPPPPPPPTPR